MKILAKKGQLGLGEINKIFAFVIILIILGFAAFIGLLIMNEARSIFEDDPTKYLEIRSVTNESVTWVNNTYNELANPSRAYLSCSNVFNGTAGNPTELSSDNFTCLADHGIFFYNTSALVGVYSDVLNVTYTYSEGGYGYNASQETGDSINDIPGWLAIFVIVLIGGILLTLVSLFRNR